MPLMSATEIEARLLTLEASHNAARPTSRTRFLGVTQKMIDEAFKRAREEILALGREEASISAGASDAQDAQTAERPIQPHVDVVRPEAFSRHAWWAQRAEIAGTLARFQPRFADADLSEAAKSLIAELRNDSPSSPLEVLFDELRRICVIGRIQVVLDMYDIDYPPYDIATTIDANYSPPPGLRRQLRQKPTPAGATLLGLEVRSRFGIAASPLTTNSNWIEFWATRGYDVLTYRTVRAKETVSRDWPNWLYLPDETTEWPVSDKDAVRDMFAGLDDWPRPPDITMANLFGVPSSDSRVWKDDIKLALEKVADEKQLLIVSVMGSPDRKDITTASDLANDFADVAVMAHEAGAPVIELNLSCPNLQSGDKFATLIYKTPQECCNVLKTVRENLPPTVKVIAKLGWLPYERLEILLSRLDSEGILSGISAFAGINAMQWPIIARPSVRVGKRPTPEFAHPVWAVSGAAIRGFALDFVRSLAALRKLHKYNYEIIGMGGVSIAADVDRLYRAGADCVQAVTAPFFDPSFVQRLAEASLVTL